MSILQTVPPVSNCPAENGNGSNSCRITTYSTLVPKRVNLGGLECKPGMVFHNELVRCGVVLNYGKERWQIAVAQNTEINRTVK